MQHKIPRLCLGDTVVAEVVEHISSDNYIVSFEGDLLRTRNTSGQSFKVGEHVQLIVTSVEPLGFRILAVGTRRCTDFSI